MSLHVALVDSVHPLLAERLAQAGHRVTALDHLDDNALADELVSVQGIIVRSRELPADLLRHAASLSFIARVGSGLENIDRSYCEAVGIRVLNSPEGNRDGVGEWCVGHLLMLLKHSHRANAQVHAGLWEREGNRGSDLFGRTVGIIGYGQMGSAFAEKLGGFGVRILAHDKYRSDLPSMVEAASLRRVQEECEVISLHLPLTDETRHFADAAFFAGLTRPVWFLNSSRGGVVHTAALLDAIDAGRITAAALDVLEYERADLSSLDPTIDPATQRRLLSHDRVILTPHIAGVTHEGKVKMAQVLADKILAAFP
ncbi:MAG: NAD(P)-dependent oxidoreductase [Flavobacteriales bacterium]